MTRTGLNKTWLIGGVSALVLMGVAGGFVLINKPKPIPTATAEAKPTEDDGHGHGAETEEEGVVELTAAQIEAVGISLVSVAGGGGGETRLSGRVEPMVDARAAVAATVGGSVERVLVAPGQTVRAGQPLVVLVSGDAEFRQPTG